MAIIGANAAVLGKSVMKFFQQAAVTGGQTLNKSGAWNEVGAQLAGTGTALSSGAGLIKTALTDPGLGEAGAKVFGEYGLKMMGAGVKGIGRAGKAMFLPEFAGGSAGWGTRMGQYAAGAYAGRVITGGGMNPLRRKGERNIVGVPFI